MKTKFYTFFLIFLGIIFLSKSLFAQLPIDYDDPRRTVFWFEIGLKKISDPDLGDRYHLIRYGSTIKHGSLMQYDEKLWAGIANGTKISIGPFNYYEDAKMANKFYDIKKAPSDTTIKNSTYFWYLIKLEKKPRLKSWELQRMPASVINGDKNHFFNVLTESLAQKTLAIGPFPSHLDAEESKRIFRLEE